MNVYNIIIYLGSFFFLFIMYSYCIYLLAEGQSVSSSRCCPVLSDPHCDLRTIYNLYCIAVCGICTPCNLFCEWSGGGKTMPPLIFLVLNNWVSHGPCWWSGRTSHTVLTTCKTCWGNLEANWTLLLIGYEKKINWFYVSLDNHTISSAIWNK